MCLDVVICDRRAVTTSQARYWFYQYNLSVTNFCYSNAVLWWSDTKKSSNQGPCNIEKNASVVHTNWITKSPAIYEEEIGKECWASILPDKIKSCIALWVTQLNIVSIADCMHFALGLYPWQYTKWIQLNAIATIEPWGQILLTNWVCLRGTGHWPHHRWQSLCLCHCLLFTSYPPLKTSDCSCKYPPHVLHTIAHENK